ncbi:hypothetical protein [Bacillus sp. AG4(2022)]|uniref:hypothetical protein n=1 Tax=Bacillus sp. AG4(2022) TaxID=2962594 RepID=UPI002881C61F|nr:hypothetical protein [Bacillus sp. AG4(2022)]MDT0159787.1 hypothetical protein [Bacillus sp. AG4(2022)]
MIFRLFIFITGFGLAVAGGISTVAYLNLLIAGHELSDYFSYILKRPECGLLPAGIVIITVAVYFPQGTEE